MMDRNGLARASEAKQARQDLMSAMTSLQSALTETDISSDDLERCIRDVQKAFDEHREIVEGGAGLLADFARAEPRLQSHVEEIRGEHSVISNQANAIAVAVPTEGKDPKVVSRINTLLSEIAEHSQHMVSLAYDALDTDIPAID